MKLLYHEEIGRALTTPNFNDIFIRRTDSPCESERTPRMASPKLHYLTTLPLRHHGDCSLLGVSSDATVFAEESYGEGWLAQQALRLDGTTIGVVDEAFGEQSDLEPLKLPPDLTRPHTGWHAMALNFAGARHRGLRGPERLLDIVRPLSLQEKRALIDHYELPITPPMLLGLAESYVLAEAPLDYPNRFVVCRRIRLARALPEAQIDGDGERFDYDTFVLYAAHGFDRTQDDSAAVGAPDPLLGGVALHRPMDCLIANDRLFVADGGDETRVSQIHVWTIERSSETAPSSDADLS